MLVADTVALVAALAEILAWINTDIGLVDVLLTVKLFWPLWPWSIGWFTESWGSLDVNLMGLALVTLHSQ
jgi:hypothetical protein